MRIITLAVAVAATFVLAAWWNQPTFADARDTADVSISPNQRIMSSFEDLYASANLENLPIVEVKEPF
jgi:hypothetical protein